MKKQIAAVALSLVAASSFAAGENNVGSCGLGSNVFKGQSGLVPQLGATFLNGLSGNQTFGISFGTLGCTKDGVVSSNWKTAMYIDGNKIALARDAAAGQGESLDGLVAVMGVKADDQAHFKATVKQEFASVFATEQVAANLKKVMAADARLAGYAQAI